MKLNKLEKIKNTLSHLIKWTLQIVKNRRNTREQSLWLFGEWWGKRCCDNSCYLANYVVYKYPEVRCIWLTSVQTNTDALDKRIRVVEWKTAEAQEYLKKAGVIVVNQNLQDLDDSCDFSCSGAIVINLWHGIPWKKIGLDAIPERKRFYSLYQGCILKIQEFVGFVCSSPILENTYMKAFLIKNRHIIKAGQPRNNLFYDTSKMKECYKKIRTTLSLAPKSRIIAYLPTFRDSFAELFSFANISDSSFYSWLADNNTYIIQKTHIIEKNSFEVNNDHVINITHISAQELMAASDMLITDYSSCFFDYLLLDRPIIHFLYDYEYYKNKDRGLYYDKEDVVCGSSPETVPELIEAIKINFEKPDIYHDLRMRRKDKFMAYESPNNCEIITQRIFTELEKKEKTK